ncbi:5-oxoprolinase subunit B family protein [Jannaschia aquimarina]|uniref:KipI protein n=1 Tax=Jannaschia aquimarina TaxID=935700 RepID=A0A0D1EC05_9RHOB|nr:carboxyltransferase domain-containing protein [Jannaschia aquimarina]KIT15254.1 Kinase A inhibitor [Jannaschia aquimarina]SNT32199.1 sensor histidine kinase inhibitor, KipI family [Jannaschia aquimarina]
MEFPRIEPLGEAAWLVRFADRLDPAANHAAIAFRAALEADPLDDVEETASSLASVLVRVGGNAAKVERALRIRLGQTDWDQAPIEGRRRWSIPCAFGGEAGPQLGEAAEMAGLSPDQAVEEIAATPVDVLALGFAPGMPYLGFLPEYWDLPRQTGLTPKVPKGALVVAVRQFVLFDVEAPTGWRQIGRTRFPCFDPARDPAVALRPGDEVRFDPVADLDWIAGHMGGAVVEAVP